MEAFACEKFLQPYGGHAIYDAFITIVSHLIFFMPNLFLSDRWRLSASSLCEIMIMFCFSLKKCDYEVNQSAPFSLFQNKKDQVTHNYYDCVHICVVFFQQKDKKD